MKRIILLLLYILSIILLLDLSIGNTINANYQIYGELGYALMHGASYGHDIIDTKLDTLLWIYALIMKVFTHGKPYFAIMNFFSLIPLLISLLLVALISKKIFYKKTSILIFIFLVCTYQWRMDSEMLVNVFTLLALYFFINKKGDFGHHWFLTGFFLGFSMLLRIPNGINILTFPLAYFLITYTKENSFKQNIVSHIKQYPTYLKYTLGCILPFLLYFVYLTYTHNWKGFLNYITYIQYYNNHIQYYNNHANASLSSFLFSSPKQNLLHVFFLISMIVVYRHHKKIFVFSCVYFVLNFIVTTVVLSRHTPHYYIQVMLIYPFVITQAITIIFNNLKNKKNSLKKTPYSFVLILTLISFIWLPYHIFYYSSYKHCMFIKKELSEKGYSYNNYLKASDKWLCKQNNFCEEAEFLKTFYPQPYTTKTDLYPLKGTSKNSFFIRWIRLLNYLKQFPNQRYLFISKKTPERIIVASDRTHSLKPYFLKELKVIQNRLKEGQKIFGTQKNIAAPALKKEDYTLKKFKKTLSNGSIFNVWIWDLK